jgi:hypothetical protein
MLAHASPEQKKRIQQHKLEVRIFKKRERPTQTNDYDCGVYVCLFALCWVRKEPHKWIMDNSSQQNRKIIENIVLYNRWNAAAQISTKTELLTIHIPPAPQNNIQQQQPTEEIPTKTEDATDLKQVRYFRFCRRYTT